MATVIVRDISEYHVTLNGLPLAGALIGMVCPPVSGHLARVTVVLATLSDDDCAITFEIGGVEVDQNGAAATLTVLDADVVGDVHVIDFIENPTTSLLAAEQGDVLLSGSILEIVGDAVPTGGTIDVTLTFRR